MREIVLLISMKWTVVLSLGGREDFFSDLRKKVHQIDGAKQNISWGQMSSVTNEWQTCLSCEEIF